MSTVAVNGGRTAVMTAGWDEVSLLWSQMTPITTPKIVLVKIASICEPAVNGKKVSDV